MLGGIPGCTAVASPSAPFTVRRGRAGRKLDGAETVLSLCAEAQVARIQTSSRLKTGWSSTNLVRALLLSAGFLFCQKVVK